MTFQQSNSRLYLLITMGMLSAFGPFVTDFYLPSLPSIAGYFSTSASMVQLSLTSSTLGLGLGQLIIGPVSDKYGRRVPLLGSLGLFIVSTAACIFSWSMGSFILFRFIQGVAGSGGVVISKSVAADLYIGNNLTRFFSMLMVVNGLAPITAPVFGGLMMKFTNWQGIFFALTILGVVLFVLSVPFKETLLIERRIRGSVFSSFKSFAPILKHKKFMFFVIAQSCSMGVMFAYISSSPFILQEHYNLSPLVYGMCFALNAIGIMAGSWLAGLQSAERSLITGAVILVTMAVVLAVFLFTNSNIYFVEASLVIMMISLGMILPPSSSLAMDMERKNSGSASAVLGFLPFFTGGIVTPLVGLGNMIFSTSLTIIISAVLTSVFIKFALSKA